MSTEALKRIERAKLRLILQKQPFFGVLFSHLKLEQVDNPAVCNTMSTNGKFLRFHPPFVESLTDEELMFVGAHEVLHNAFEHHIRRKERNPKKWNRAADYVINATLVDAGVGKMPDCGLLDRQYDGMSAEEIYAKIPDEPGDNEPGNDPGGCGGVEDGAPPFDEAAIEELRAEQQIMVRQAASYAKAKMAGSMPESLKRLLDQLTEPRVNWADQLRNLVANSLSITDQTWNRPNRRYIHAGLYLPGLVATAVDHIVVAVDTSGSIDGPILNAFGAEVRAILDEGLVDKISVIYADARVQGVEEFSRGDEVVMNPVGGGGTAFSDTFNWIKESADDAVAVIYLTDLYVNDYGTEPDCPVIWTVWGTKQEFEANSARVPFGSSVHIQVD